MTAFAAIILTMADALQTSNKYSRKKEKNSTGAIKVQDVIISIHSFEPVQK